MSAATAAIERLRAVIADVASRMEPVVAVRETSPSPPSKTLIVPTLMSPVSAVTVRLSWSPPVSVTLTKLRFAPVLVTLNVFKPPAKPPIV